MRGWQRGAIGVAALAVVLLGYRSIDHAAPAVVPPAAPLRVVSVAIAGTRDVPVYVHGLGTVDPFNSVLIKSLVDGAIKVIRFEEGQTVKAGDVLFEIDPRPYQAEQAQAEATLAKDQAQLANAGVDLQRFQSLSVKEFATRQSVDTQKALVAQFQAQIAADQAQIEQAKLKVGYATIRAPIGGRVGRRLIDLGNVVLAADSKPLVMLTQIQPIAVTFTVPQDVLPDIQARMAGGTLTVEALGSDAQKSLATGRLALVGDTIDKASGTIALKAVFENADLRLWPGQFVNARLMLTTMTGATVVPASALMLSPAGKIAYVVKSDSTVAMRVVETGVKMQDFICVTKGLSPGEMVVIDGQDSISDGAHVNIANPPTAKAVG